MELPDYIASLIEHARDKRRAFLEGTGTMHDSASATIAAREALSHWMMLVIHDPAEKAA